MATLKRIEKRMNDVEAWVKDFEQGQGPAQTMENLELVSWTNKTTWRKTNRNRTTSNGNARSTSEECRNCKHLHGRTRVSS